MATIIFGGVGAVFSSEVSGDTKGWKVGPIEIGEGPEPAPTSVEEEDGPGPENPTS